MSGHDESEMEETTICKYFRYVRWMFGCVTSHISSLATVQNIIIEVESKRSNILWSPPPLDSPSLTEECLYDH